MTLMRHSRKYAEQADLAAKNGAELRDLLGILRQLSLDDFGQLMFSLPSADFKHLSAALPPMASEQVQKTWTGATGIELLKRTLPFVKQVETNFVRYCGKKLQDATVLDFGCGYGRFIRMLYYFTDPENIWGIDAWDRSLKTCEETGLPANFAQSERTPTSLPVGSTRFDVGFAFSVFTHLAPETASSALGAIRKHMNEGGIFTATIRPVEFWPFIDSIRETSNAERLTAEHRKNGYAYIPHGGQDGETYGDISMEIELLQRDGWEIMAYDSVLEDPFQVSVILKAV